MRATEGDRIVIRGKTVERPDRRGEILEVRRIDGGPPYLVLFDDRHESIVYPGADFVIERSSESV
ncbi:DUF1918 domain-containing protein [Cryobacterium sp. M91]|uniref:DUF1918 domain-containing protein n=1 Tax=Cryobacterium sp. M91 TaxID=2048294 RepID=UPI000CE324E7|nr:DUF1918 domain-containing protein [Cryobacterium sp. M91]